MSMSEIGAFCTEHPFLAWCALWLFWGFVAITVTAYELTIRLICRLLRTIKVVARGWPPPHLDADGDWRPVPKPDASRRQ